MRARIGAGMMRAADLLQRCAVGLLEAAYTLHKRGRRRVELAAQVAAEEARLYPTEPYTLERD